MPLRVALATITLPAEPPEWVHLLPMAAGGVWRGRDGRGPYRMPDAQAVVAETLARWAGRPAPIDFDHALDLPQEGRPGRAAAWLTAVEARRDGIWGRVEWTDAGAKAVAAKEYRFLSPVFAHDRDGTVRALLRAGLTNVPNFDLMALASADPDANPHDEDPMTLEELLAQLRTHFGLTATADVAAVAAHAGTMASEHRSRGDALTAIAAAIGIGPREDVVAGVRKAVAGDDARYVAVARFDAVQKELAALQAERAAEKAAAAVDTAITDGRLVPAMRDWALDYARRDPEGFKSFAAAAPVIAKPGARGQAAPPKQDADRVLDAEDLAVCAQLGISADDYKKSLATAR